MSEYRWSIDHCTLNNALILALFSIGEADVCPFQLNSEVSTIAKHKQFVSKTDSFIYKLKPLNTPLHTKLQCGAVVLEPPEQQETWHNLKKLNEPYSDLTPHLLWKPFPHLQGYQNRTLMWRSNPQNETPSADCQHRRSTLVFRQQCD